MAVFTYTWTCLLCGANGDVDCEEWKTEPLAEAYDAHHAEAHAEGEDAPAYQQSGGPVVPAWDDAVAKEA